MRASRAPVSRLPARIFLVWRVYDKSDGGETAAVSSEAPADDFGARRSRTRANSPIAEGAQSCCTSKSE